MLGQSGPHDLGSCTNLKAVHATKTELLGKDSLHTSVPVLLTLNPFVHPYAVRAQHVYPSKPGSDADLQTPVHPVEGMAAAVVAQT